MSVQRFVNRVHVSARTPIALDYNELHNRALRECFNSIAAHLEHGEFYGNPLLPMISGWRQQGADMGTPGQFVEYEIKVRIGSVWDLDAEAPTASVEALVDDGIEQDT